MPWTSSVLPNVPSSRMMCCTWCMSSLPSKNMSFSGSIGDDGLVVPEEVSVFFLFPFLQLSIRICDLVRVKSPDGRYRNSQKQDVGTCKFGNAHQFLLYVFVYVFVCLCVYNMCICADICACVWICVDVQLYMCARVCVRERERKKGKDRQRERERFERERYWCCW